MRAAREKLLAVPGPIVEMRTPVDWDGLHVMQLDGDAIQDIFWRGLQTAPAETYIKKAIECGRHSLPHRGHEAAEWRRF